MHSAISCWHGSKYMIAYQKLEEGAAAVLCIQVFQLILEFGKALGKSLRETIGT